VKTLQITLIVGMGLLLFGATVLPPQWLAIICILVLLLVIILARRRRIDVQPSQRKFARTILSLAIALGIVIWALLARLRG
jgi:hypothetical protein